MQMFNNDSYGEKYKIKKNTLCRINIYLKYTIYHFNKLQLIFTPLY